jgi:hypothetical protein
MLNQRLQRPDDVIAYDDLSHSYPRCDYHKHT